MFLQEWEVCRLENNTLDNSNIHINVLPTKNLKQPW